MAKKTLFDKVKIYYSLFYEGLEKLASPRVTNPFYLKDFNDYQIDRMNNIMSYFYKRKILQIKDKENIKFFDFKSRDGLKLSGLTYMPNPNSKKWIISCHWFAGHKFWSLAHAKIFADMGYNVMTFDFRNHGKSDKANTTLGYLETIDFLSAIDWMKENIDYDHIALLGISMGAFIINYACVKYADEMKEARVKFGISEGTYSSIEQLLYHGRNIWLRIIPKKKLKKMVIKVMHKHNKINSNEKVDLFECDVLKLIENGAKPAFPIYYVHGHDDKITSSFDTYDLLVARKNLTPDDGMLKFNFCMHTQAIRVHFKLYAQGVGNYIAKMNNDMQAYKYLEEKWELDIIDKKDIKSDLIK